jgi:D-methionine transport system substrate-binding protein
MALINTNYALKATLNPLEDALFIEDKSSPYVNILVTRKGNEKREALQKLAILLKSAKTKEFIMKKYNGAIVPAS